MLKVFTKNQIKLLVSLMIIGFMAGCTSKMEHKTHIDEALIVMKAEAAQLGEPKVIVDSLFFGDTKINNNFNIVDSLKAKFGCTATFFVKEGNDFLRVSTDVLKDGIRAIGTKLDPAGPVIKLINRGKPFYGVVDVLGTQFESGYEPIKNSNGKVIGIYFVGFEIGKK